MSSTFKMHGEWGGSDAGSSSGYSEGSEGPDQSDVLPPEDKLQIEAAFRALGTQVTVCGSLANLYRRHPGGQWVLEHTGIPAVLLDSGAARRPRRITLVLAERRSALALFTDIIDNLSAYRASAGWHTMCLSTDHAVQIGLSFSNHEAASQFWAHIENLISDPGNISLSIPGSKKPKPKPIDRPLPAKTQISQPCCFQHVTSVGTTDVNRYTSLQTLLPPQEKQ